MIGIISHRGQRPLQGLYLSPRPTFDEVFARPESSLHYVRLNDGADAERHGQGHREDAALDQGVQADSLRQIVDDFQAQSRGFLYLIQGFMGIGLFVGIAAVGVIAFRTVVERRQQIGMLRAIGYTRRAVAHQLPDGVVVHAAARHPQRHRPGPAARVPTRRHREFAASGISGFYIPGCRFIGIGGFAFLASLVMTIIPRARRPASPSPKRCATSSTDADEQ